ncbi:hypothetical protein B0O99DRAFT_632167 [Bisporella sp. PMI_857]|nr:hypothetical protein B0O99DRAFT_632167 [Bisporella sp. PMI_857]
MHGGKLFCFHLADFERLIKPQRNDRLTWLILVDGRASGIESLHPCCKLPRLSLHALIFVLGKYFNSSFLHNVGMECGRSCSLGISGITEYLYIPLSVSGLLGSQERLFCFKSTGTLVSFQRPSAHARKWRLDCPYTEGRTLRSAPSSSS